MQQLVQRLTIVRWWATRLPGGGDNYGGGALECTLNNCIIYYNNAPTGSNYDAASALNYCCTTPMPTNSLNNVTNAPQFIDLANGNLRLQSNSPCINSGNNAYVTTMTDIDGRPRIIGGTVDMGAYENQDVFNLWLQQYGLPTDGSADFIDSDNDGMNNWQEYVCGTDPKNPLSVLRMLTPAKSASGLVVSWQSVGGINYYLQSSATILPSTFSVVQSNIVGQAGVTSFNDANATGASPLFYRIGVQ